MKTSPFSIDSLGRGQVKTERRLISTQTAFVLVSLVTILLLVASAILSRIVFTAAEAKATLYFKQANVQVKTGTDFKVDILADLSAPTYLTGLQLEIKFDSKILKATSTQPVAGWKQIFQKVEAGKISLALVPLDPGILTDQPMTGLKLARLSFTTLAEGATSLTMTPTLAMLAVSNTPTALGVENIIESVINAQVIVSNTEPANATNEDILEADVDTSIEPVVFSNQRIIASSSILTVNSAVILVQLQHPSQVSVAFGQDRALGNRADFTRQTDQAAIRLSALESGRRYFYQVEAADVGSGNKVLGQVKSFELPALSPTNIVERTELTIFPARATTSAVAYAVILDKDNKIISGLDPVLQIDNQQVSTTRFSEVAGLYQASLSAVDAKRQTVRYTLLLKDQKLATASAVFDPSRDDSLRGLGQPLFAIKLDQRTINLILALVAGLIILGLGFYRLARSR